MTLDRSKILVTGATGKTGRRLVALLRQANTDYVAASRQPDDPKGLPFDWTHPDAHDHALEGVTGVYVIFPSTDRDPAPLVIDFCRKALGRGVRRIVLLSGSLLPEGGPYMGQLHAWLRANAPEWAVLRPSWFMQNFTEDFYLTTILAEGVIYSGAGHGRVGFIDADDIARSALGALTAPLPPNREFILTGPEALSYDAAAAVISEVSGRRVRHVPLDADALIARLIANGFNKGAAQTLGRMDALIAQGAEDRTTDDVLALSGMAPSSFDAFARAARQVWV
jgi:uncharacterized protein YbjT (DUF2867 family)